jgi:uridine kinase
MTVEDLADLIESRATNDSIVVGICGLSGSGKTTLANTLAERFPDRAIVVSLDDFCVVPTPERKRYLDQALKEGNRERLAYLAAPTDRKDNPYADPVSWYDWRAAAETIMALRAGKIIERDTAWNQTTGLCDKHIVYEPPAMNGSIYIVECIYLFEPPLASQIDISIMIDADPEAAAFNERKRDEHRSEDSYLEYKKVISEQYCIPYLEKHKSRMTTIVKLLFDCL